jgi:putative FmdB family regulatory protein
MPTYDYSCKACSVTLSVTNSIAKTLAVQVCPLCSQEMVRVYELGAVTFKGSGFYVND